MIVSLKKVTDSGNWSLITFVPNDKTDEVIILSVGNKKDTVLKETSTKAKARDRYNALKERGYQSLMSQEK